MDEARGIGRKAGDQQSSARLEVRFAPAILSFLSSVWGDYWIIGLGPEYTWAVVGTPSREYLWILSRTPEMSATSYERALEIARGNGFDVTRRGEDDQQRQGSVSGDAHRAGDARPAKAAVPVRVLRQVLLVIVLGVVELRRRKNLGRDGAEPAPGQLVLKDVT